MNELFDVALEIKSVSETGTFAGYGSVYNVVDEGGDLVAAGAFAESLAAWNGKGRLPALLWQHRSGEPIGVYKAMREDANGLHVEGQLALKTQRGAEAHELMKLKAVTGLSIGYQTRDDSFDQKTGVRTIRKADLWEVSLVTFPMNDQARVAALKNVNALETWRDVEGYLRDAGASRAQAVAVIARVKELARRDSAVSPAQISRLAAAVKARLNLFLH